MGHCFVTIFWVLVSLHFVLPGVQTNVTNNVYRGVEGAQAQALNAHENFAEVTVVPVATAGVCNTPCRTIYPFLILLFFMTFVVASTQMPLLMIVLRYKHYCNLVHWFF